MIFPDWIRLALKRKGFNFYGVSSERGILVSVSCFMGEDGLGRKRTEAQRERLSGAASESFQSPVLQRTQCVKIRQSWITSPTSQ